MREESDLQLIGERVVEWVKEQEGVVVVVRRERRKEMKESKRDGKWASDACS
jgi:hypothetical protein